MSGRRISRLMVLAIGILIAQVVGVSPAPADDLPVLVGRWSYGPTMTVAATWRSTIFGSGSHLMIADPGISSMGEVIGEIELPEHVVEIAASGHTIYAVTRDGRLFCVDVRDPENPVVVSILDLEWTGEYGPWPGEVVASNDWLFIANGSSLVVCDVRSLSAAVCADSGISGGSDIALQDDIAYLALGSAGVGIVDLRTPWHPEEIGVYSWENLVVTDIVVSGTTAAIASNPPYPGRSVIRTLDLTDPVAPELGAAIEVEVGRRVSDLGVGGSVLFIGEIDDPYFGRGYESVLRAVDLLDPASPVEVGSMTFQGPLEEIAVQSGRLVSACRSAVEIVDVSDPTAMRRRARLNPGGVAVDVAVSDGVAYQVESYGGLRIIDVSDPSAPSQMSFLPLPGDPASVALAGELAVITGRPFFHVIDVSDPWEPLPVGEIAGHWGVDVEIDEGLAFVATGWSESLSIVDIGDPTAPFETGYLGGFWNVLGVAVTDGYVVLADFHLEVVDARTPSNPLRIDDARVVMNRAIGVDIQGDRLFVAAEYSGVGSEPSPGLHVLDISRHDEPVRLGYRNFLADSMEGFFDVAVVGDLAYLTEGNGLWVIDVTRPHAMIEVAHTDATTGTKFEYTSLRRRSRVTHSEGHVFTVGHEGLSIFRALSRRSPRDGGGRRVEADGTKRRLSRPCPTAETRRSSLVAGHSLLVAGYSSSQHHESRCDSNEQRATSNE